MISILSLFNSVCQAIPDYKAGVNPIPEFLVKVNDAQKELMDAIAVRYDQNERIRTLLDPFVVTVTGTANGTITKPSGFYRTLGITVTSGGNTIPAYQAKENELIDQAYIPQRKASLANGIAYYKQAGTSITVIPSTSVPYTMYYLRSPAAAVLAFTYGDLGNGELALSASTTTNLEWDESAYNMILNLVLRRYGVTGKDELTLQVSNSDIANDLIREK